jgi:hypothetical protein
MGAMKGPPQAITRTRVFLHLALDFLSGRDKLF